MRNLFDPCGFAVLPNSEIPSVSPLRHFEPELQRTFYNIYDRANARLTFHPCNMLVLCMPGEKAFDTLQWVSNIFALRPKIFLSTPAAVVYNRARKGVRNIAFYQPGPRLFARLAESAEKQEIDRYRINFRVIVEQELPRRFLVRAQR